jgi:hypothetical protein
MMGSSYINQMCMRYLFDYSGLIDSCACLLFWFLYQPNISVFSITCRASRQTSSLIMWQTKLVSLSPSGSNFYYDACVQFELSSDLHVCSFYLFFALKEEITQALLAISCLFNRLHDPFFLHKDVGKACSMFLLFSYECIPKSYFFLERLL